MERPEPTDVHTGFVHHRDEITVDRVAAERVEQHTHPHALPCARAARCSANSVPIAPFQYTNVRKSMRALRAVDRLEHRGEDLDAVAQHVDLVALGRGDADEALDGAAELGLDVALARFVMLSERS